MSAEKWAPDVFKRKQNTRITAFHAGIISANVHCRSPKPILKEPVMKNSGRINIACFMFLLLSIGNWGLAQLESPQAAWLEASNYLYTNEYTQYVGILNEAPIFPLDVGGAIQGEEFWSNGEKVSNWLLSTSGSHTYLLPSTSTSYVGIGTSSPTAPLTIVGKSSTTTPDIRITSDYTYFDLGPGTPGPHGFAFGDDGSEGMQLVYRTGPNQMIIEKGNDFTNLTDLFSIDYDTEYSYFKGNVGIGVTEPDEKLVVDGVVKAEEILVTSIAGADFVFEPDYALPSLGDVEAHIRRNKHLPGIPPASEMQQNGVSMGELQTQLLQKIEELTLYMIDLKKENDLLKGRVSELEKK
ncbi:MAG: hypothetical protein CL946_07050 [Ectothiorhodospiraceae bacterium]|nr:hypothetical protein [Ectothiorhodospiraceae bacterium]